MLKLAQLVACVAVATCQEDQYIHQYFRFEVKSGFMVFNTHDTCYLWKLSDSDVALVKDPATLREVEGRMFTMMKEDKVVEEHTANLDPDAIKLCAHQPIKELDASV